jgi:hypothetical protein
MIDAAAPDGAPPRRIIYLKKIYCPAVPPERPSGGVYSKGNNNLDIFLFYSLFFGSKIYVICRGLQVLFIHLRINIKNFP